MPSNRSDNKNNRMNMPRFNLNWVYVIIIIILAWLLYQGSGGNSAFQKEVNYSDFQQYVSLGYASKITINKGDGKVTMYVKKKYAGKIFGNAAQAGNNANVTADIPSVDNVDNYITQQRAAGHFNGQVTYEPGGSIFSSLLVNLLLPTLLIIAFWWFFIRQMNNSGGGGGGGIFSVGKSKARIYDKEDGVRVTFKDVAGQDEAKQEVQEIVKFLKSPKKYTDLGGKIPKGVLLVGPPGTGKTLLAKAVAGEANVPFFSISGSDFVEMFVGVGASRVRDLFRQAKEKAPCIVFIDEIDAVGRARGRNPSMGGNDERENTLNQLLTEMDGFVPNSGIIVLAATNRADILDKALLRAGRFDRQIHVELPGLPERKQIFLVHMKPLKMDNTVDVDLLARQTPGFSGADIANVCNEAALIAARRDRPAVGKQEFLDAIDRIIGGMEKKTKVMTAEEKRTIAIHEAGHATISWFLQYANPLVKVTIVPRGQSLGAAWYLPEERTITTREQMLDEICATLGGRAAEDLFTGHISSGALNDLERVNKSAFGMVAYLGMSDNLSNICYYDSQQEYSFNKPYSDRTAELIDKEVKDLIRRQYERAKQILEEHREGHAQLAQLLIDREVIFAEDVEKIFGKRPWVSRSDELIAENDRIQKELEAKEAAEAEKEKAEQDALKEKINHILLENGELPEDEKEALLKKDAAKAAKDGATQNEDDKTAEGDASASAGSDESSEAPSDKKDEPHE
ncbi:MAG: ATP-dependent zinc metalloprotease FtsH [Prevotellaceae bacterium]|nr:ATP-dependent zinc metalloprotease FtsH [Prevotellaceae bacterium]MDY3856353.1 ATP-dependent zinc metalloprotease FtsH [Bacteroidaceae bacterium]